MLVAQRMEISELFSVKFDTVLFFCCKFYCENVLYINKKTALYCLTYEKYAWTSGKKSQ